MLAVVSTLRVTLQATRSRCAYGVGRLAALRFLSVTKAPSGHLCGYHGVSGASARDVPPREEGAEVGPPGRRRLRVLLTPGLRPQSRLTPSAARFPAAPWGRLRRGRQLSITASPTSDL